MRALGLLVLCVVGCTGAGEGGPTRGPIERIVRVSDDEIRLHAVRHRLVLADLPVQRLLGLPATGTIEVDAAMRIPVVEGVQDWRAARGTLAVRCVGRCTLGDGQARLPVPGGRPSAFTAEGIAVGPLDIDLFEATITARDGKAYVTRWGFGAPDVLLDIDGQLALARALGASTLHACIKLAPTDALETRDPGLHALLSLASPVVDAGGFGHLLLSGPLASPRLAARQCSGVP